MTFSPLLVQPGDSLSDFALCLPNLDTVACHKAVLCAASPKLARVWAGENPKARPPPASIPCPSETCADAVLRFVYLNRFPLEVDALHVDPLLQFAREWELEGLVAFLEHKFASSRADSDRTASNSRHWREWAGTGKHLDFSRVWGRAELADVVLALSDDSGAVLEVGVSRAVLASQSEFFRCLFAVGWQEGRLGVVPVRSPHATITATMLQACVQAAHGLVVGVKQAPCELMMAAFYLGVEPLLAKCQEHIVANHLSSENVCQVWTMSDEVGAPELSQHCKAHFQQNFVRAGMSSSFVDLPFELLREALLGGEICGSTSTVLQFVGRWASHNKDDTRIGELFPPHTMMTREWKMALLCGGHADVLRFVAPHLVGPQLLLEGA